MLNYTSSRDYILAVAVFLCGAVVMIYEIVGSRVVAPYIGVSTYVWTSLIGVILGSLSLGYYLGGRMADKNPRRAVLARVILSSAFAIAFTIFIKDSFSSMVSVWPLSLEIKTIILSLILFAPASILLGIVSPYAVKLATKDLEHNGRTVGNLYAISTLGSIIGTFFAGFYLIPATGSTNSLFILVATLIIVAILLFKKQSLAKQHIIAILLCISISIGLYASLKTSTPENILADVDTEYSRILVLSGTDKETGRPARYLVNDPYGIQSGILTDDPHDILFEYIKFFTIVGHFIPDPKQVLMIGGSAYTYPRSFLTTYPDATIDVVEIDPGTTEIARKYFGLTDLPHLTVIHEDGRIFLNQNTKKYDAIFIDTFNSGISAPFHLTTIETAKRAYDSLSEGGVVLINIISAVEGEKGKLLRAEYATFKEVFPQVYLFPVRQDFDSLKRQNVLLVAHKSTSPIAFTNHNAEINKQLSHLLKKPITEDMPILTDDYAPVDYYMRESI